MDIKLKPSSSLKFQILLKRMTYVINHRTYIQKNNNSLMCILTIIKASQKININNNNIINVNESSRLNVYGNVLINMKIN